MTSSREKKLEQMFKEAERDRQRFIESAHRERDYRTRLLKFKELGFDIGDLPEPILDQIERSADVQTA